jgi:hypothetical protein
MAKNRFIGFVAIIAGLIAVVAGYGIYGGFLGGAASIGGILWIAIGIFWSIKGVENKTHY